MTQFVLATANPHKTDEMRAVLSALGITLSPRPSDVPEVAETGETLEENALLKARALVDATGQAAVADDTGLFVDALDGRPGVRSARYAGEVASYDDNVTKLLGELVNVAPGERTARFRSVVAVAYPDGTSFCVEGVLPGVITDARAGDQGFGYDPVFAPLELGGRTLAELTPEEKNEISHRARALRALAEELVKR
ncbi:MAG TPA: RdgB/HAM1 family non-canonical purine NTP pyrophosphatase [Acidimicrobiales bacterium]